MMRTAALLLLASGLALADTVWLRDGTSVTGKVTGETTEEIRLKVQGGAEKVVKTSDAALVELADKGAARAGFEKLRKPGTADALVEAARYAFLHGMRAEGDKALAAALQKDPGHTGAKEAESESVRMRLHDPKDDAAILKQYGAGWRLWTGERYRLVTNVDAKPEDFDRKLVDMMDKFWDFYCATFDVKPDQKKLHNIVVYATREQFDAAPGSIKGAYGVYQHGDPFRPAVLWYMEALRGSSFTSRHECGHQFVAHYVRPDGEGWFSEGIATTFECQGDVPIQDHLYRWEIIRKQVLEPGGVRIADMMKGGDKTPQAVIYALGAAVHLFFLEGKERTYRAAYQKFLKSGDTKSPDALAKAIGKPMDVIQAEFEAWVRELDSKRKIFPPAKK